MTEQNYLQRVANNIRNSVSLRIFVIGFLMLVLLIPASMVKSLITERENRKNEVIDEISSKWGNEQTIAGPILSIPFKRHYKNSYSIEYMHFLPDELNVTGSLSPEIRYRGIYEAVLYNATIGLSGKFSYPKFKELNIFEKDIVWSGAFISLGISDLKGITEQIDAKVYDNRVVMNPGIETNDVLTSGISSKIRVLNGGKTIPFQFGVRLNGSHSINFVPIGEVTKITVSSSWPSPSFDGSFLPTERTVNKDGFHAKWKVLHLNRNFPQYWIGSKHKIADASFGVKLFIAADVYQKSMRTAKYALMFISFTFLAFFFSEIMNRKRIHPIQYLLIGFAIIIFYTLLLSISEHLNFDAAYLISSFSIILLITAYSHGALKNKYLSITVGGILLLLYGYLYLLLQLEDYALLMGSIGLFVVLSGIMFMTRKIDWYAVKMERGED